MLDAHPAAERLEVVMFAGVAVPLVLLFGASGVGLLISAAGNQRAKWWATAARQYRNPEAAEPSDAALSERRATMVVVALVFFGAAFFFGIDEFQRTRSILPRMQEAAGALGAGGNWPASSWDDDELVRTTPYWFDPGKKVEALLDDASDQHQVLVLDSWRPSADYRTHTFQVGLRINGKQEDQTACLTVTGVGEPEPTRFPPIRKPPEPLIAGLAWEEVHVDPGETPAYREVETTVTEGSC